MSADPLPRNSEDPALPNGPGAAAVLAAGIGALALGIFTILGDKNPAVRTHLNFYSPTGPLSGVTTVALALWLLAWVVLGLAWKGKSVPVHRIAAISFILLALALLLTFPPVIDLF